MKFVHISVFILYIAVVDACVIRIDGDKVYGKTSRPIKNGVSNGNQNSHTYSSDDCVVAIDKGGPYDDKISKEDSYSNEHYSDEDYEMKKNDKNSRKKGKTARNRKN